MSTPQEVPSATPSRSPARQIGRYGLYDQIAAGGMASVHLARLAGPVGFSRVVAVKHLHPHLSLDPRFKTMFLDEARMAARVRHPNVVPILDLVVCDAELFLVMEYVEGEALSTLRRAVRRQRQAIPAEICSAILIGALQGLHAAHEARDENGQMLNLVHRDVSPPNILVGVDGVPMVLDFGVAKAMQRLQESRPGVLKGKSSYMAPEQIRGEEVGRATDVFAAAVVLWELLTGRRLFGGATEQERMYRVLHGATVAPPTEHTPSLPAALDDVVLKGLRPDPAARHQTALAMAEALERALPPASQRAVGEWVARTAVETLARRAEAFKQVETSQVVERPAPPSAELDVAPQAEARPRAGPGPGRGPRGRFVAGATGVALLALGVFGLARSPRLPAGNGARAGVGMGGGAASEATAAPPRPVLVLMGRAPDGGASEAVTRPASSELGLSVALPPRRRARRSAPHPIVEPPSSLSLSLSLPARTSPQTVTSPPALAPEPTAAGGEAEARSSGRGRVPLVEDEPRLRILE